MLAVASGGGHWIELLRLRPAFSGWDVAYVSTFANYATTVPGARYYIVPDASRFNKIAFFFKVLAKALPIALKERPSAIVTTGSAPMLAFLVLGRLLGARTLWMRLHRSAKGHLLVRASGEKAGDHGGEPVAGGCQGGAAAMLGRGAVIFASVGSMLPFERMVRWVDQWAGANPEAPVFHPDR
ncbi:hypothetical protein ACFSTD_11260 [Novosphingobium colocasiae]